MARTTGVRSRALGAVALALCLWALPAATASAGDSNTVPATVELRPAGPEGIVGPKAEALAYFSTPVSEPPSSDTSGEYFPNSKVRFACEIDGRPVRCESEYIGTEAGVLAAGGSGRKAPEEVLPGFYVGSVPLPKRLASGPHTVTVVATDEDGTDPDPPTMNLTFDRKPPSKPVLVTKPPRRSRIHKPIFKYTASDGVRLVRKRGEPFAASLIRLKPTKLVYREQPDGSYLGTWFPRCESLTRCSGRAQAVYSVSEHWYSFGEAERLVPGLYEFRVRSIDAVRNRSPLRRYRFRVLPGRSPLG